MRTKWMTKAGVVAAAASMTMMFGQTTAQADVLPEPTEESVAALQTELEGQGYVPETTDAGGVLTKRYEIDEPGAPRFVIETTEQGTIPPGTVTPYFRVGVGNGIYVYLNNAEQQAVLTGGVNALATAICAVPAVGQAACAATIGALNAAAAYINARGAFCPNELEINYLRWLNPAPHFKCV